MKILRLFLLLALVVPFLESCKKEDMSCPERVGELRLNQLQVVGSHNSYRQMTYGPILQFMRDNPQMLPEGFNPNDWDYGHEPLDAQLNTYGMRSIELDVFDDPAGGLFYNRMGLAVLGMSPESGEPSLLQPGLKVMHFPDLDYNTHFLTFKDALNAVKTWSQQHSKHVPIVIQIEPKEDNPFAMLGAPFTNTIPFSKANLGTIDQEIKDVFGSDLKGVITPDEVRGAFATLNEAILKSRWPDMHEARGKVLFVMDGSGTETADYLDGHASLNERVMFVFSEPGKPEAAFLKYEDPTNLISEIKGWVEAGYIVRTRADADTKEARSGDTRRRDAAFECGAQIISTDYYRPDPRGATTAGWTGYYVKLPAAGVARANPVTAPNDTKDCEIEE
jgi:hypothetical protein